MKRIEISKSEKLIGGYNVWYCGILSGILSMSPSLTEMQFDIAISLFFAFDCIQ